MKLFVSLALGLSVLGTALAAPKTAVCPVMGKTVNVTASTPKAVFKGQTYYFCCAACKPKFDKDPAKFAAASVKAGGTAVAAGACCKDGKCSCCADAKCTCCKDGKCTCGADCKCACCKDGKCACKDGAACKAGQACAAGGSCKMK